MDRKKYFQCIMPDTFLMGSDTGQIPIGAYFGIY